MDTVIRFKFDGTMQDNLTWDDLEILESGKVGASKNILARFVVDENQKPVPEDKAKKMLGALKVAQIQNVMAQFMTLINDAAINPPTAA